MCGEGAELGRLRALILAVEPALADARFRLLDAGWDSAAVEVDGRLIFKFPRDADAGRQLVREAGMLALVRDRTTLAVPDLVLAGTAPLFSRHAMIAGDHLNREDYEVLPEAGRAALAGTVAAFLADLHAIPLAEAIAAGAEEADNDWPSDEAIAAALDRHLPADLAARGRAAVAAWSALPPDPHGLVFGHFDAHGWNMAFDRERGRINGIYDFGDAGLDRLHREFVHPALTSADLAARIVAAYEARTGRAIDRRRVALETGMMLIAELAEEGDDRRDGALVRARAEAWLGADPAQWMSRS